MDLRRHSSRIYVFACFALVALLLTNNLIIQDDPAPARSSGPADVNGEDIRLGLTFQLDEGDRLSIDLDSMLFNIGMRYVEAYEAYLFVTPRGDADPDELMADAAMRHASGVKLTVDEPHRKGTVLEPQPPTWQVVADEWLTLVVIIDHGGRVPNHAEARELWGELRRGDFESTGPFGPENAPYQVLTADARAAQPWLNVAEGLALGGIVLGAVISYRGREPADKGLAAGVALAQRARGWLATLHDLLWTSLLGLVGLAVLVFFSLGDAGFWVNEAREPDAWYMERMVAMLLVAFAAAAAGLAFLLRRVRRAAANAPDLDLDG